MSTRVMAVKAYPNLVWHYTEDRYWSLCDRWVQTLSAEWNTVSNVPEAEKVCKHCLRQFNAL
jgi:hypothetical protein